MRRSAGWAAQALLAYCAVLIAVPELAAGQQLGISSLRWYTEDPEMLLCADAPLVPGEVRLLVYTEGVGQTDYVGSRSEENCATFTVYFPQSGETNTFGLLVVDDSDVILQQGHTIFTLLGEEFSCGQSNFARITSGSISTSTAAYACLPDNSVCYCDDPGEICLTGLDPENNPDLLVCIPVAFPNVTAIEAEHFVADSLTYVNENLTASLSITHSIPSPSLLTELLSRADGEFALTVGTCANNLCVLDSFTPSSNNYLLCGVFLEKISNSVTGVGETTFQDFELTVDETTIPIILHIIKIPGEDQYEIYHGPDHSSVLNSEPSPLDCSKVPDNSFCYGVVNEPSAYVAVSYVGKNNSVVAPVPAGESFVLDSEADQPEKSAADTEMAQSMDQKPDIEADDKPAVRVDARRDPTSKAGTASRHWKKLVKSLNVQNPNVREELPGAY